MEWFSKLFEIDKLPFKVVFLVAVVSGLVAFSPEGWLQSLQLEGFKENYGTFVGVTFLASFGLASTNVVIFIFNSLLRAYYKMKWKAGLTEKLQSLDHSEQAVLREFYIQGKYTIDIPINDSSVVGLTNKGIVRMAGKYGEHSLSGMLFPCAITEEARKRITNQMIGLPDGDSNQEELQRLKDSRPSFVRDIERRNWLRNM
jgi:hypothetical protein